ncbi:MAG TPA: bifunctional diaminohydroxyphosphoribosylaminopyrimidine deaminase/5-amino-6-(5-phosphoribosylamino)uracil reductase RibD [Deltaproteobacteria bacterium]|nr:bifunctional diaminohydroxyphosphoribosylaminopyrimidine deaminase/5-amino-6-(5-phosphoribosylamino)uracil reductase RibD [Deltaproteobacteria bacterium]
MKEEEFMRMALSLARKGLGTTSPNPMVGALIVKGQKIVGEGYHKKAGMPHAEVVALEAAGPAARGATLYVNLEPCCHQGRTPPCVGAIIKAGIKKVVVAMRDPNPLVLGKGIEQLKRAGIDVKVGLLEAEARQLNEAFVTVKEQNRPFILMKAASSLDGKIATKIGESRWISNEESRKYANKLRSTMDGVMVGINTVILDNPMLVPRMTKPKRYPVRIVLDSKLRIPLTCQLVKTADRYRTIIFALNDARTEKESRLKSMSVEVVRVGPGDNGRISLAEVCKGLVERDITSVLLEGGGELNSSLLKEGFVDKIVFFYAPKIIGGKNASNLIAGKGVDFLKDAYKIDITSVRKLKEDICVEGYVHRDN